MFRTKITPRIIAGLALVTALLVAFAGTAQVSAQESDSEPVKLSIKPVNSSDSYFTVSGSPGEVIHLQVELANHGTTPIEVHTYPADVYSLVNGGFGVELADEPTSKTTHWLGYPVETFEIDAETAIQRTFSLTIPEDATAGEYLSALVIQNANPVGGESEGIGFQQVNRQAIAVAIEIPGERLAGIALGAMEHQFAASRSVISAEVENTGNVHLKPQGQFVLVDGNGDEVLRRPVTMGSVYAGTATLLEVPFAEPLAAGEYSATLELGDVAEGVSAETGQVAITVPEMPTPPVPANPEAAENPDPQTSSAASESVSEQTNTPDIKPWMLVAGIAAALILGAGATFAAITVSRRRRITDASSTDDTPTPPGDPEPEIAVAPVPEPAGAAPAAVSVTDPAPSQVRQQPITPVRQPDIAQPRPSRTVRQLLNKSKHARSNGATSATPSIESVSWD